MLTEIFLEFLKIIFTEKKYISCIQLLHIHTETRKLPGHKNAQGGEA